jgi:hypothetical protein
MPCRNRASGRVRMRIVNPEIMNATASTREINRAPSSRLKVCLRMSHSKTTATTHTSSKPVKTENRDARDLCFCKRVLTSQWSLVFPIRPIGETP